MKRMIGALSLALAVCGCSTDGDGTKANNASGNFRLVETNGTIWTMAVAHDDQRGVTCWIKAGSGMFCITDAQLAWRNPR